MIISGFLMREATVLFSQVQGVKETCVGWAVERQESIVTLVRTHRH